MHAETFEGVNSFLTGASKLLVAEGVCRTTRGEVCYELPEPVIFKITNPMAREVTIPIRKWFKALPYAESLWIASGRNDMAYITHYLPKMINFSDDKVTMRGGYGPRFRDYNGEVADYRIETLNIRQKGSVDQLRYVIECFKEDVDTRRAVMAFGDPVKDDFDKSGQLKRTKDIPCTRELHFIKQSGGNKLDLIVRMRSNDLIWGASAVNVFNYTFMQEYVAAILGLEIGNYFHIADNLHYYKRHSEMVHKMATIREPDEAPIFLRKGFSSLHDFDALVTKLSTEERTMRLDIEKYRKCEFEDEFFQHWYDVLYNFNRREMKSE